MFFKGHIERARMDVCNLGKTKVILDMLWLVVHNPEIDWEKGEVKMMQYLPICGKREIKRAKKGEDKETLSEMILKKFWKQKKIFGKKKSEQILVQKAQDHAIELKEGFVPKKEKMYSLSREEREKVQVFMEDQCQRLKSDDRN